MSTTEVEQYLREHWYATRSIGRLLLDLDAAKAAYSDAQSYVSSSAPRDASGVRTRRCESPVELSAIIAAEQHRAQMMSIAERLENERQCLRRIEKAVADAQLNARESAYVRLRYYENNTVQAVARRMYCSVATCGRIRARVVNKVGHVIDAKEA